MPTGSPQQLPSQPSTTTLPAADPPDRGRGVVVVAVLVSVLVPVILAVAGAVALWWFRGIDTVGAVDFESQLRIPPLAPSTVDDDGTRVFELTAQTGRTDLTGDGDTETWGVGGAHLAPTLRAERGERVRVDVRNDLPEPTTLHWHGMHLPAAQDGGPHQPIEPGALASPAWLVDQPAATTWYHPHAHGTTAAHVRRGVYGMFLVDEPDAAPAGLPDDYGVDDIPVMVQDASFTGDGQLRAGSSGISPTGPLGDTLLVNGTVGPYVDVTSEAVRLRLLNASAARVYDFALADGRTFDVVGTDGGLLSSPRAATSVLLSPGERAEVVIRLSPGERVVLRSMPPELGVTGPMVRMSGARDTFDVLELRAADRLTRSPELPRVLAPAAEVDAAEIAQSRTFDLENGDEINGLGMDMARVDAVATAGTTEEWVVRNLDGMPHNFHIHGLSFVVASVDGDPAPAELQGWKDTVLLPPGREVRLLVPLGDDVDPENPYMFHCHLLAHADDGMMGQFVVVGEGQQASVPDPDGSDAAAELFPAAVAHDH